MTFEFDDNQTQYIVNTLAQRPFAEVHELMALIQRQAANQPPRTAPQLVPVQPPTGT